MRTIVYIDGFNLFYGLLRNTPWLWLDLERFVRSLLTEKYDIVAIKFFTARIHSDKFMLASPHDQACYLEALMEFGFWRGVSDTSRQFGRARRLTQRGRGWYNFNVLRGKVCSFRGM